MEIYNRLPDDIRHKIFRYFRHPNAGSIQTIPKDIDISLRPDYCYKYELGKVLDDKPIHTKLKALGRRRISLEILREASRTYNTYPLLTCLRLLHRVKFKTIVSNLTNEYNELDNYLQKKRKFDFSDGKIQSQLIKYYKYIEYYEKQLINLFNGFAPNAAACEGHSFNLFGRMIVFSCQYQNCTTDHRLYRFRDRIKQTNNNNHSSIKTKYYKKNRRFHSKRHYGARRRRLADYNFIF